MSLSHCHLFSMNTYTCISTPLTLGFFLFLRFLPLPRPSSGVTIEDIPVMFPQRLTSWHYMWYIVYCVYIFIIIRKISHKLAHTLFCIGLRRGVGDGSKWRAVIVCNGGGGKMNGMWMGNIEHTLSGEHITKEFYRILASDIACKEPTPWPSSLAYRMYTTQNT